MSCAHLHGDLRHGSLHRPGFPYIKYLTPKCVVSASNNLRFLYRPTSADNVFSMLYNHLKKISEDSPLPFSNIPPYSSTAAALSSSVLLYFC